MEQTVIFQHSQEKIFNILFDNDEITWQTIIYDLIQKENMNPWDIDVSRLSQKFLEKLKELKELDFRISGKMVLAAAILLKIKSKRFIDSDIAALDQLIASTEESVDLLEDLDEHLEDMNMLDRQEQPRIYPKTPQPRKRKVSVYDLVNALEKALEVENRRRSPTYKNAPEVTVPEKKVDMHQVIKTVYGKVKSFFAKKTKLKLTFEQIIPSQKPIDKVMTFVPLLHLENQRKVDLLQEKHFGNIEIQMVRELN